MKSDNSCSCLFFFLFCFVECALSIAMHVKKKKGIAARSFIEWGRGNSVDVSYSPFPSFFFFLGLPVSMTLFFFFFFFFDNATRVMLQTYTQKKRGFIGEFQQLQKLCFFFF